MSKILIVDDEPNIAEMIVHALKRDDYELDTASGGLPAIEQIQHTDYDLVISDVMMPDADGFAVLDAAMQRPSPPDVIIITGFGSIDSAVEAMKRGAAEYITKPFDLDRLREAVENALGARAQPGGRREPEDGDASGREGGSFAGMVGRSEPMRDLYRLIEQVARTDSTVVIHGESGSGKELVARAIHQKSTRNKGPFIAVDCGALTETLLESELFGHVKGAFTGAIDDKAGLFEAANGGTIFMDEIGEMTSRLQQKLLRAIQERAIRPVGSTAVRDIDVRILSATNHDLARLVEDGIFRSELYYRLNVVSVSVPALGERRDDVPLLARHFARLTARRLHRRPPKIGETVLTMLQKADWPGNVRQLANVIECAVMFAEGDEIRPEHLPPDFIESFALAKGIARTDAPPEGGRGRVAPLGAAIRYLEHQMLSKALDASDGNREEAAAMLGIDRATLYRKLKAHRLAKGK